MIEKHPIRELSNQIRERETIFSRPDRLWQTLYVVTTVFNAARWRSRWRLYEDFAKHVAEAGARLITVEIAFGDRAFVVTEPTDAYDIQLRTETEIWFKERALNIGFQRAASMGAQKIAWIDADAQFARADWADETLHQLEHFNFVQMWSQYQDLTPDHELVGTAASFASNFLKYGFNPPKALKKASYYGLYAKAGYPGAPGLAWAARRDALDYVGGLLDICIMGACDWYMAHAMIGRLKEVIRPEYHARYRELMLEWQARCQRLYNWSKRGILGVVPGVALHHWHGKKADRKYKTRDQILVSENFNPDVDLKFDTQGLYQLTNRSPRLRDAIRQYFRERNEDSIDL